MNRLEENTTYYVRAYATNSAGTGYGNTVTFTTPVNVTAPQLTTAAITNLGFTTATSGGTIIRQRRRCHHSEWYLLEHDQ